MYSTAMGLATPKAIRTAQAVLQGSFPLAKSLGVHFHPQLDEDCPWAEWLFNPEAIVSDLSDPASRSALVPGVSSAEAEAMDAEVLDCRGILVNGKVLGAAAKEALQTLVELAEGSVVVSPRLRARLCVAARQELVALVAEWDSLEPPAEVR